MREGLASDLKLSGAAAADQLRLLPACELGCGRGATDTDFAFQPVTATSLSVPTASLPSAVYKGCYAYAEDLTGSVVDMGFAVELPLSSLRLTVSLDPDVSLLPKVELLHLTAVTASVTAGGWSWYRVPLLCAGGLPLAGCADGDFLSAGE